MLFGFRDIYKVKGLFGGYLRGFFWEDFFSFYGLFGFGYVGFSVGSGYIFIRICFGCRRELALVI